MTLQLFSAAIPEVLPDVAPPSAVGAAERLLAPVLVALVKEGPMPLTPSQLKERAHLPESTPDDVIVQAMENLGRDELLPVSVESSSTRQ